jgi:uncharacterized membrane protein YphA (DoxX/SURF4 family)
VLGVLLIRQGALGLSGLPHLAQTMELHSSWQTWPITGSLRPMEMAIWIAAGEFAVGMFLVAGLLTRVMALSSTLLSLFALATLGDLGLIPNIAHATLLAASLAILIKGGGAGTMDKILGGMQRKSMEREAQRDAEREAARAASSDSPVPS